MAEAYNVSFVVAEMLRKLADGWEVDGQAYLDVLGDEHGPVLTNELRELALAEVDETVEEALNELADGNTYLLGEFGEFGEGTEADQHARRLRELADLAWPNGAATPIEEQQTGSTPA